MRVTSMIKPSWAWIMLVLIDIVTGVGILHYDGLSPVLVTCTYQGNLSLLGHD